jgi:hypothetical protein
MSHTTANVLAEKLSGATLSEQSEQRMRTGPETPLPCIADFAIYPIGTTIPFSEVIDKVEAILKQLGMSFVKAVSRSCRKHPTSTNTWFMYTGLKYNIHEQGTV